MSRPGAGVRWYSQLPLARILLTSAGLVAVPYLSVVLDLALRSTAAETDVYSTILFYLPYFGLILSPLLIGGFAVLAVAVAAACAVARSRTAEATVTATASLAAFYGLVLASALVAMESGWWIRMAVWGLGVSLAGWLFHRTLQAASDRGSTDADDVERKHERRPRSVRRRGQG